MKEGFLTFPAATGSAWPGMPGGKRPPGPGKKGDRFKPPDRQEAIGSSRPVLPFLVAEERPLRVMIISPPQAEKTTLLRDIVRSFSNGEGVPLQLKSAWWMREKLPGASGGTPVGCGDRTDVLTGCPKQDGIFLLLRSMSPQVIATDEIGRPADLKVIEEVLNAGVGFIVTAHAWDTQDLSLRPVLREIWLQGLVEKVIILSRRFGSGTLEGIWDGKTKKALPVKPVRLGWEIEVGRCLVNHFASTAAGWLYGLMLRKRRKNLADLRRLLQWLETEIGYNLLPLREAFFRISQRLQGRLPF